MQLSDVQRPEAVVGQRALDAPGWRPVTSRWRLVLLSFLMLFTELALIRWTAANNVYLAYITNFVLLASFLGIGVGFLRVRLAPDLLAAVPVALAVLVAFVLAFPVGIVVRHGHGQLDGGLGSTVLP